VLTTALVAADKDVRGVILMMEEQPRFDGVRTPES